MANAIAVQETTSVIQEDGSQAVRIPDEFRFRAEHLYVRREPESGVLQISEKPFKPTLEEIFAMFDALDWEGVEFKREQNTSREIDL